MGRTHSSADLDHTIDPHERSAAMSTPHRIARGTGRSLLAAGGIALLLASLLGLRTLDARAYLGMALRGHRVVVVDAGGPAGRAGFQVGDEVLAVDGVPTRDALRGETALRRVLAGRQSWWVVERDAGRVRLQFPLERAPGAEILWRAVVTFTGIAFILVGLAVVARRGDRLGRLFGLLCFVFGFFIREPIEIAWAPAHTVWFVSYTLATLMLPALLVHFTLLFPVEKSLSRRHPQILWISYGLAGLLFLVAFFSQVATSATTIDLSVQFALLEAISMIYFAAAVVVSVALFIHSHRVAPSGAARRRLVIPLWGTLLGLLPMAAATLVHAIRPGWAIPGDRYLIVGTVLVPLSFAYAIVRHGVFDLTHLARRGMVVASLLGLVVAVYGILAYALGGALRTVVPSPGFFLGLISALLVALVAVLAWGRLQRLVDRALFPERLAERRTLREMSRALATCINEGDLLRLLAEKLPAALGSATGVALLWDEAAESFDLAYAHGVDVRTLRDLRLGRGIAKVLRQSGRPLLVEEMGNDLPFGFLPSDERQSLARLGAEAVLPIRSEDRLHGLVVFGGRRNGRRFGPEDIEVLETLAALAGTAAENARLHGSLIEQERITRELELAREIQEDLLPREDPVVATVEIAGRTVPCEEVGGDYYDYVILGRRRLAVVIGDAAGKGIPAALMTAGVQATLRAEAERGTPPAALLRQLNRRVLSMEEPGRFVSLCFGYLDTSEPSFHYANAGHDPPIRFAADGTVERLGGTGLLLGVARGSEYSEARLALSSGDLLLFYTDGVVDRSRRGEPFGEERLIEILGDSRQLSAREVRERVLAAVAGFSDEDPPDDFTVVVVRIL